MARAFVLVVGALVMAATVVGDNGWENAHATFYGDMSGGETMKGACGYGDLFKQGYGLDTAALSTVLFSNGQTCGACYELRCLDNPEWCIPDKSTVITATNFCPPNWTIPSDNGGWCNPPRQHFDMSMPAFLKIVKGIKVGIVPIQYRRVPCVKQGGIKIELTGDPNWIMALLYNVGGAGDITAVSVKGSNSGWIEMSRNWGQNWQTGVTLVGQSLSFRVTASDGRTVELDGMVPANWQFGQNFEGNKNF